MINLVARSSWQFETSGSGGFSIDVVAASGGLVKLFDPAHREEVLHFGGIGAGISTPGIKIPKLGNAITRQLSGRALNGGGAIPSMWNTGVVLKTAIVGERELTRADFVGACVLAEIGASTPIIGRAGSMFLTGIDPFALALSIASPAMLLSQIAMGRGPALAPKAVIFVFGDSRGLMAGGTGYVGYMR